MYIGKNFIGAFATAIIWTVVALCAFMAGRSSTEFSTLFFTMSVIMGIAFGLSYFILNSLDKTYAQNQRSRVDRFLTSLDDNELDALRDRLSGGIMGDGEYGSLDDLLMENEVKAKRR